MNIDILATLRKSREPVFPEGTRVMLKPLSEAEANAGVEQPEGRVVVAGFPWYTVQLDPEFRPLTNPDGHVDVREEMLIKIEEKS